MDENRLNQLRDIPQLRPIVERWETQQSPDISFELTVAAELLEEGIELQYEVNVNSDNDKSVDFQFQVSNKYCNLELVRIGLNETLASIRESCESAGFILTSDNDIEDFRTAAQVIKLQWGLLEKADKFPEASTTNVNVIAVDCTNVHGGMMDCHDVAITMFGRPYEAHWTEFWNGQRITGIWEDSYAQRGSAKFRSSVSAVIFFRIHRNGFNEEVYVAINPYLTEENTQATLEVLQSNSKFQSLRFCRRT